MQMQELREKNAAELREELLRLRKEQFAMRMQRASEQLPQTHLIATTRRDIARVKTVMREQDIQGRGAATDGGPEPNAEDAAPRAAEGGEGGERGERGEQSDAS